MSGAQERVNAAQVAGSVLARHVAACASRRKAERAASVQAVDPPPAPVARTPERAAGSAIARAAERVHGLAMYFDRITTSHAAIAELGELLPDHALISVVEGRGEALGAVAICPGLLTSLIEMQALGRISSRPAVSRKPTRTDAAICTDFVNACLTEVGAELATHAGFEGLEGYRYANFLDDPRLLELMLEDVTYRLISVSLRAGPAGQRDGRMIIILPVAAARPAPPAIPAFDAPPPPAIEPGLLADRVQEVPIELLGILCRRHITLGELQGLTPGDKISLPAGVLAHATLETSTGQTLFRGRLGEMSGHHAIRVSAGKVISGGSDEIMSDATFPAVHSEQGDQSFADPTNNGDGDFDLDNADSESLSPVPGVYNAFEPPIADLDAPDVFRADAEPEALPASSLAFVESDSTQPMDDMWHGAEFEPLDGMPMQIG